MYKRQEFQIKKAVSCKAGKHMVEKADARIDLILATSVQIQFQGNIRLPGLSIYNRSSLHDLFLVPVSYTHLDVYKRQASFSVRVPLARSLMM